jgi:hypothetical protein
MATKKLENLYQNNLDEYKEEIFEPKSVLSFDCETSGLDPNKNQILSLGFVYSNLKTGKVVEKEYRCRLKEGKEIDENALKVNGFTLEKINEADMNLDELVRKFVDEIISLKPDFVIGYNVSNFDWNFIYNSLDDSYKEKLKKNFPKVIDLIYVTKNILKNELHLLPYDKTIRYNNQEWSFISQNASLSILGYEREPDVHIAVSGSLYCMNLFYLLYLHKPFFRSHNYEKPKFVDDINIPFSKYVLGFNDIFGFDC